MAQDFIKGTASVNNGETTVTLDGNVDASFVVDGTSIFFEGFSLPVQALSGTIGEITLKQPWQHPSQTSIPFTTIYTIMGLVNATNDAKIIKDEWGQAVQDVDDIVATAGSAVDDLNALEPRIDAAEADLLVIETDLQTYRDDTVTAASNAATSESNAATSETNAVNAAAQAVAAFDNFDDKYLGSKASDPTLDNDGDPLVVGASYWNSTENELRFYNGATWDRPEETATQAAATATNAAAAASTSETNAGNSASAAATSESNASTSENNAATSESNALTSETNAANDAQAAEDAKLISAANANYKGEWSDLTGALNIPASVKHGDAVYMLNTNLADVTLSEPAGVNPDWFVIGSVTGRAPDSDRLGGELPAYYATADSVSNIDNTSDADKPISTATQAALDEVEVFALAGMVM